MDKAQELFRTYIRYTEPVVAPAADGSVSPDQITIEQKHVRRALPQLARV